MLALLSCPKVFSGDQARIQRNAVENWLHIGARPHLAGPTVDVESIPDDLVVEKTVVKSRFELSTLPDFNDLLEVLSSDEGPVHGYANADIILPDILSTFRLENGVFYLREKPLPKEFLITGSRWDFSEGQELPDGFDVGIEAMARLASDGFQSGALVLNRPDAMDFFIFPPGLFHELDPLIVGRGGYDNALIAYCLRRRIPVIDVSRSWPVLHQFHGYAHKEGGKKEVYLGDEAMFNRRTHDIVHSAPNSLDADFIFEEGELKPSLWRCGLFRRMELTFRYRFGLRKVSYLFRALQRLSGERLRIERREMRKTALAIKTLACH